MTDKPKASTAKSEVRAGVSEEQEKEARKESREVRDEEVTAEIVPQEPVVVALKDLPEDGFVALREGGHLNTDGEVVITPTSLAVGESTAPAFPDQFHGIGGQYVIDPESGDRKRVYEELFDTNGKSLGYRPAP